MVASGWACRCSMNAAISRIGPSTLVVTTVSAEARNDSGCCQSSTCMMPAIATSTLRSGCLASTSLAAVAMLAASAVSIRTVSMPGCSARDLLQQVGAPAADDHGVAAVVQRDREGEADAAGGAGNEDGVAGNVHASSLIRR